VLGLTSRNGCDRQDFRLGESRTRISGQVRREFSLWSKAECGGGIRVELDSVDQICLYHMLGCFGGYMTHATMKIINVEHCLRNIGCFSSNYGICETIQAIGFRKNALAGSKGLDLALRAFEMDSEASGDDSAQRDEGETNGWAV
jgi:hypothetical protein